MSLCFLTLRFRRATLLVALATASSLTTAADSWQQRLEERGYRVTTETAEVRNYELNGWNALDETHLMINAGPSRRYLVTFRSPCRELRNNEVIAFSNTVNRLTKFDKAVVRGTGGIKEDCFIESIHALEKIPKPE